MCQAPYKPQTASGAVVLSRLATASCGTNTQPLILQARPGQNINVSLYDFSSDVTGSGPPSHCTHVYGQLKDLSNAQTVQLCSGSERHKHVMSSTGHTVQITLSQNRIDNVNAILKYEGDTNCIVV